MKAFIVDDSKAVREKLREILESLGHSVVAEAGTGQEILDRYSKVRPDLVTLDMALPDMDGLTALMRLRKQEPRAKVLVVGAATSIAVLLEAREQGASYFLIKPFKKEKVEEALREVSIALPTTPVYRKTS